MPLDGHAYLSRRGWAGKGQGLREGSIAKPLHVSRKKTLSGLGKDRDEAFPFWDHVFSAAAKSITIRVPKDSDDELEETDESTTVLTTSIRRTTTGIISNRRPAEGTPIDFGASTPQTPTELPARSLLARAKQQAARSALYSKFYRGPVLVTEDEQESSGVSTPTATAEPASSTGQSVEVSMVERVDWAEASSAAVSTKPKTKKRKRDGEEANELEPSVRKSKKRRDTAVDATVAIAVDDSSLPSDQHPLPPADSHVPSEKPTKKKKEKRPPLPEEMAPTISTQHPSTLGETTRRPTTEQERRDKKKKKKRREEGDDGVRSEEKRKKHKES